MFPSVFVFSFQSRHYSSISRKYPNSFPTAMSREKWNLFRSSLTGSIIGAMPQIHYEFPFLFTFEEKTWPFYFRSLGCFFIINVEEGEKNNILIQLLANSEGTNGRRNDCSRLSLLRLFYRSTASSRPVFHGDRVRFHACH